MDGSEERQECGTRRGSCKRSLPPFELLEISTFGIAFVAYKRSPWAPSGPRGRLYATKAIPNVDIIFILKDFRVTISYSCNVSCRILGVLLSHPCIVEVGLKRPHFCTYKPPSGLLSSKCELGQYHHPKRGLLYATRTIPNGIHKGRKLYE